MKITPTGIHVLIEPIDVQANKIVKLTGKAEGVPDRGKIIAVGEAVESETIKEGIGKLVFYRQHADEPFEEDGVHYHLVEEVDVMAVYEAEGHKGKA